jgi:predicted amidophosphoribosyltransferase
MGNTQAKLRDTFFACIEHLFPPNHELYRQPYHVGLSTLSNYPSAPGPPHSWIYSVISYQHPPARQALHILKKSPSLHLVRLLSEIMYQHILELLTEHSLYSRYKIIVVPIPKYEPGYNHSADLARRLVARQPNVMRYIPDLLLKIRATQKQALLKRSQRLVNLQNAFCVNSKYNSLLEGRTILLVDDIVTTGATLVAARETLMTIPSISVIAITVAH